ncbi:MAG: hypothetical protein K940chlam9_01761 [Chlamydiae bacterium]|nr:hypothetical protein [Chlamydiota bacterium]
MDLENPSYHSFTSRRVSKINFTTENTESTEESNPSLSALCVLCGYKKILNRDLCKTEVCVAWLYEVKKPKVESVSLR